MLDKSIPHDSELQVIWSDRPTVDEIHATLTHCKNRLDHYQFADQWEGMEMDLKPLPRALKAQAKFVEKFAQDARFFPTNVFEHGQVNGIYDALYWVLCYTSGTGTPNTSTLRSDAEIQAKVGQMFDQIWHSYLRRAREWLLQEQSDYSDTIAEIMGDTARTIWQKLGDEPLGQQTFFAEGYRVGMYIALEWVLGKRGSLIRK